MKGCFLGCFGKSNTTTLDDDDSSDIVDTSGGSPTLIQNDDDDNSVIVKRFSWEEIEKMTDNFSQVIGVGGHSTVYLGRRSNSLLAAVKVYNCGYSERLNREFRNELNICREVDHHPNIVKLLGYCDQTTDEGVLVFEYIPHGNLQDHLHNNQNTTKTTTNTTPPSSPLSWTTRVAIAYQLASALDHLHEQSSPHIVHGDIKPSNILLLPHPKTTTTTTHIIKLCDFGSANKGFTSTIKPPNSSSSSSSRSSMMMMGSPGYIDPHYLMTGLVSKKSDIYGLGVLILELITGLEAYCSETEELLTARVRSRGKNNSDTSKINNNNKEYFDVKKVVGMVDDRIKDEAGIDEIKAMACIAATCVHHMPSCRPTAAEVCRGIRDMIGSLNYAAFESGVTDGKL